MIDGTIQKTDILNENSLIYYTTSVQVDHYVVHALAIKPLRHAIHSPIACRRC